MTRGQGVFVDSDPEERPVIRRAAIQARVRRRNGALHPRLDGDDWETLEYVDADPRVLNARTRALQDELGADVALRTRQHNPPFHLHLPPETVHMGTPLDLKFQRGDERTTTSFEGEKWLLLCEPDAFDLEPGEAAIYLVRSDMHPSSKDPADHPTGSDAYEDWHERDPEEMRESAELPDFASYRLGTAAQLGYRSDKWGEPGEVHDYDHDFSEHGHEPPEIWADAPDIDNARLIVLYGGDMSVTTRGID